LPTAQCRPVGRKGGKEGHVGEKESKREAYMDKQSTATHTAHARLLPIIFSPPKIMCYLKGGVVTIALGQTYSNTRTNRNSIQNLKYYNNDHSSRTQLGH